MHKVFYSLALIAAICLIVGSVAALAIKVSETHDRVRHIDNIMRSIEQDAQFLKI